jgi:putative Mg2+ transporter-C (MgtC) family protein
MPFQIPFIEHDIAARLLVTVVLAGALGIERELKGRGAGLRTHVLVGLGACLAMVLSDVLAREWNAASGSVWLDKGRIAAGVLTGIGFIGAGAIIQTGSSSFGLTTAAMVWFVACVGLTVGAGLYAIAIVATLLALFLILALASFERVLPTRESFVMRLVLEESAEVVGELESRLYLAGYRVDLLKTQAELGQSEVQLTYKLSTRRDFDLNALVSELREKMPAVQKITCER